MRRIFSWFCNVSLTYNVKKYSLTIFFLVKGTDAIFLIFPRRSFKKIVILKDQRRTKMIRLGCRIILHVFSLNKKQNIVKIYNFYYQKRSELSFLLVCFFLALKKRFNTNSTNSSVFSKFLRY